MKGEIKKRQKGYEGSSKTKMYIKIPSEKYKETSNCKEDIGKKGL